jgi:hypothetical protein
MLENETTTIKDLPSRTRKTEDIRTSWAHHRCQHRYCAHSRTWCSDLSWSWKRKLHRAPGSMSAGIISFLTPTWHPSMGSPVRGFQDDPRCISPRFSGNLWFLLISGVSRYLSLVLNKTCQVRSVGFGSFDFCCWGWHEKRAEWRAVADPRRWFSNWMCWAVTSEEPPVLFGFYNFDPDAANFEFNSSHDQLL